METIDRNCQRVRVTVLDVFAKGKRGKSRNITIYNTTCDEVYAAIERLPDAHRETIAEPSPSRSTKP